MCNSLSHYIPVCAESVLNSNCFDIPFLSTRRVIGPLAFSRGIADPIKSTNYIHKGKSDEACKQLDRVQKRSAVALPRTAGLYLMQVIRLITGLASAKARPLQTHMQLSACVSLASSLAAGGCGPACGGCDHYMTVVQPWTRPIVCPLLRTCLFQINSKYLSTICA